MTWHMRRETEGAIIFKRVVRIDVDLKSLEVSGQKTCEVWRNVRVISGQVEEKISIMMTHGG